MIMIMITVTAILIKIREKLQEGQAPPPCQSPFCPATLKDCFTSMGSV